MASEKHGSKSMFEGRSSRQDPPPKPREMSATARILIITALVVGVATVLVWKHRAAGRKEAALPTVSDETVLAMVGAEQITLRELQETLKALPPEHRSAFEKQKDALLEELITRKLLLQQARAKKIAETQAYRDAIAAHEAHPGHEEHVLIDVLLRTEVLDKVQVSEADLRAFYEQCKDQLPGRPTFEQAREMIRPSVEQQEQFEAFEAYLARLKEGTKISRNYEWIEAQRKAAADNPLDRALKSGKPVLADFGRGTCIPCKMMKPILDKLSDELSGRVHVLILDTTEYAYLARQHGIRVIPTQIFFSAGGKELFRHEGFMSREDILSKLGELQMVEN